MNKDIHINPEPRIRMYQKFSFLRYNSLSGLLDSLNDRGLQGPFQLEQILFPSLGYHAEEWIAIISIWEIPE